VTEFEFDQHKELTDIQIYIEEQLAKARPMETIVDDLLVMHNGSPFIDPRVMATLAILFAWITHEFLSIDEMGNSINTPTEDKDAELQAALAKTFTDRWNILEARKDWTEMYRPALQWLKDRVEGG
jgi:hypothetical protein